MMTRREVFEKVKAHLLKQNARSVSWSGRCLYVDGDRRCDVGCLMNKDQAKFFDDGYVDFRSSIVLAHLQDQGVPDDVDTQILLQYLQDTHDNYRPEDWPEQLDQVESLYA